MYTVYPIVENSRMYVPNEKWYRKVNAAITKAITTKKTKMSPAAYVSVVPMSEKRLMYWRNWSDLRTSMKSCSPKSVDVRCHAYEIVYADCSICCGASLPERSGIFSSMPSWLTTTKIVTPISPQ